MLVGLAALTASTAGAYYHFVRYTNRFFPYAPAPERFDLNALPNKTVTFFVSDQSASQISQPEAFPSLINAVREAARVWNGVATSELRVAFGGLITPGTPQSTPGADVVFEEMDPATLGFAAPTVKGALSYGPNGPFVPIQRSVVRLNRDLANWTGPSFHEAFFLTTVHEMGHALGLQHTFTSSGMATDLTRATTLARPLDQDDVAGLSWLYPAPSFAQTTGSISGRVVFQGANQGVHLASVVAIRPGGSAISALTDPDGRFRIDGLPPDFYVLYVHPLPPARPGTTAGDIVLPRDADGREVQPSSAFDTVFYAQGLQPTRDLSQVAQLQVTAGAVREGVSLTVRPRSSPAVPWAITYSFFGQTAVKPAYLRDGGTLVVNGPGLASNNTPTQGLSVSFLGGTPVLTPTGLRAYGGSYLALDLQATSFFGVTGQRHAVFTLPSDMHVRPLALSIVQDRPPTIGALGIENNSTRSVVVAGADFKPDTSFYFDGIRATLLRYDESGRAVVAPPPGLAGQRSVISAFNADGQNSMFLQSALPVTFSYDSGEPGGIAISPSALTAGGEGMVEISGINTSFQEGLTLIGFGSSDVQVRRVWVLGPARLLANVWVAPEAPPSSLLVSVVTGFQVAAQPFSFQVNAANPLAPVLSSSLVNTAPGQSVIYPGAVALLAGSNLSNPTVTVGDRPAQVISSSGREVRFQVPAGLPTGPAILRLSNGVDTVSIVVQIDLPHPEIRSITASGNGALEASRPAVVGDTLTVTVAGLVEPGSSVAASRILIKVGTIDHPAIDVVASQGAHQIQFTLKPGVPTGPQVPVTVWFEGRSSAPYAIPIRSN